MSKHHTPGPWYFLPNRIGRLQVGPSINYTVADMCVTPLEGQEANARLIAAAPELLDALEELCACPQWVDEATVPKAGIETAPQQVVVNLSVALLKLRKARAAIAKATGGDA